MIPLILDINQVICIFDQLLPLQQIQRFQILEQMSRIPTIMKTIAKKILNSTGTCNNHQKEQAGQISSQDSQIDDVEVQISEQKRTKNSLQKGNKQVQISQTQQDQNQRTKQEEEKEYFIKKQNNKLKLLYPTFDELQITKIASQLWDSLTSTQKNKFRLKMEQQKQRQEQQMNYLETLFNPKPESAANNDNELSCFTQQKETKNEACNFNEDSINVNSNSNSISAHQNSQRSQGTRQEQGRSVQSIGNGQGTDQNGDEERSNAETKASEVINDQSNQAVLPEIFALVQYDHSQVNEDQQSKNNSIESKEKKEKVEKEAKQENAEKEGRKQIIVEKEQHGEDEHNLDKQEKKNKISTQDK